MFYELKLNSLNYWNCEKRSYNKHREVLCLEKRRCTHFQELTFLAFQNNEAEVLATLAGLMILNEKRKKARVSVG